MKDEGSALKRKRGGGRTTAAFVKNVADTICHYDMLRGGERVLAAVSGGPDSVGMLKALLDMRRKLKIEVLVANMDHGIRGPESERDSEFVKQLAGRQGLEFIHKKVALKNGSKGVMSLEERAREERYRFLLKAAREAGCQAVATGHTLDDQAETVLMRVISGASPSAVGGIPPVRCEGGIKIIRPFIRVEKYEILRFLRGCGWEFVEDSTNKELDYARNKVRHEVVPFLEKYNPKLKRSLANLADGMREELEALRGDKAKAISDVCPGAGDQVSVAISDMMLQPRALRKEIFKELLRRAGGNIKKLTYRHWMEADKLLRAGTAGGSLDLPGDIRVTRTAREVMFARRRLER